MSEEMIVERFEYFQCVAQNIQNRLVIIIDISASKQKISTERFTNHHLLCKCLTKFGLPVFTPFVLYSVVKFMLRNAILMKNLKIITKRYREENFNCSSLTERWTGKKL